MRVIFAGGGTGGHINPAISIADYAKSRDKDFSALFIGTKRGLETKLVPAAGYDIKYIDVEGFDRKHLFSNFRILKKLIRSRKECRRIIREFRPDCVVTTGGYVSGPVVMAAHKEKVPSLIHEQNVYPGLTVRGSEKYVDYLALSFDETINEMKFRSKCRVTGNPIREEILRGDYETSRRKLGITGPFVLIFGGSLGASKLNEAVTGMLERLADENCEVVFGTGDRNYDEVMSETANLRLNDRIIIMPYIDNMAECMAAADIVVSRSGAITVSEVAALGKPAVFIPSPNVVRNHQEQNARELEKNGAACVIVESELTSDKLYATIKELLADRDRMNSMAANAKKLAKTDALAKIYALMTDMSKKNKNRANLHG